MTTKEILDCIPACLATGDEDYVADGLVYCGKCRTPKQIRLTIDGVESIYPCLCYCQTNDRDTQEAKQKELDELRRINDLRVNCIADRAARGMTFDMAMDSPNIKKAKKYVSNFKRLAKSNTGILMVGGVGTGKTFTAACIANALIDKGVPVLVTSFPRILTALQSLTGEEREDYYNSLDRLSLIVFDDLGAERQSQYALEVVYTIISNRVAIGKPMIITTNISPSEMEKETNIDYQRIYDRILGSCVVMKFDGMSMRRRKMDEKLRAAAELLKED